MTPGAEVARKFQSAGQALSASFGVTGRGYWRGPAVHRVEHMLRAGKTSAAAELDGGPWEGLSPMERQGEAALVLRMLYTTLRGTGLHLLVGRYAATADEAAEAIKRRAVARVTLDITPEVGYPEPFVRDVVGRFCRLAPVCTYAAWAGRLQRHPDTIKEHRARVYAKLDAVFGEAMGIIEAEMVLRGWVG